MITSLVPQVFTSQSAHVQNSRTLLPNFQQVSATTLNTNRCGITSQAQNEPFYVKICDAFKRVFNRLLCGCFRRDTEQQPQLTSRNNSAPVWNWSPATAMNATQIIAKALKGDSNFVQQFYDNADQKDEWSDILQVTNDDFQPGNYTKVKEIMNKIKAFSPTSGQAAGFVDVLIARLDDAQEQKDAFRYCRRIIRVAFEEIKEGRNLQSGNS